MDFRAHTRESVCVALLPVQWREYAQEKKLSIGTLYVARHEDTTAVQVYRQARVAHWTLCYHSLAEIVVLLADRDHLLNPATQAPWGKTTVARDVQALKQRWREAAAADTEALKADQLAALRAVRRDAWSETKPDYGAVLKSLKQEAELLGTDAATKRAVTSPDGITDHLALLLAQAQNDVAAQDALFLALVNAAAGMPRPADPNRDPLP